MREAMN